MADVGRMEQDMSGAVLCDALVGIGIGHCMALCTGNGKMEWEEVAAFPGAIWWVPLLMEGLDCRLSSLLFLFGYGLG